MNNIILDRKGVARITSSTDNALLRWDGTNGYIVQNSKTTENDSGGVLISCSASDALTIDSTGSANTILRIKQGAAEKGAIYNINGSTDLNVRSQNDLVLSANNASSLVSVRLSSTSLGLPEALNITVGTTTGTKIGISSTQKIAFYGATPVVRQAHITDADGTLGSATTQINLILDALEAYGLLATS